MESKLHSLASVRRRRPRGTGSLRQRAADKWELRYKETSEQVHARNETEARKLLGAFVERARNGGIEPARRMTFDHLADAYLASKARKKAPTTIEWYTRNLRQHVRPVIGKMLLADLRPAHVQKVLDSATNGSRTKRRGQPLGPATERNLLIAIRAVLRWGVQQGHVLSNVATVVDLPEEGYVERPVLGIDDVKSLLAATKGTELEPIIATAIGTGLRRSELCALRWSDLDLEAGTIRVCRAAALVDGEVVVKAPKTKRSQRMDHLPAFVLALLRRHKTEQLERFEKVMGELEARRQQRDGYVFARWTGDIWNPNELSKHFSRLVRGKKLPLFRLHDMRHGYASLAFAAGVPLKVVSESLGHSGIAITAKTYVHLLDAVKRENADRIDAYLDSAVRPANEADLREIVGG